MNVRFLVIVPSFIFAFQAQAEESCLSFGEVIQRVVENGPEIIAARANLELAESSKMAAKSLWRPKVDVFTRNSVGENALTGAQLQNQVGLLFNQRLYDFGDGRLALEAAKGEISSAVYNLRSAEEKTALDAALIYVEILRALATLNIRRATVEYYETQQVAIDKLLELGLATLSDKIEIDIRRQRAAVTLEEERFNLNRARTELRSLTLSDRDVCADKLALGKFMTVIPTDADSLVSEAMLNHAPLRRAAAALKTAKANSKRESRSRYPIISAQAITAYASNDEFGDWSYQDQLGLDVTIPLYAGNEIKARQDRSRALVLQRRAEEIRVQRDIEEEARLLKWREISLEAQILDLQRVAEQLEIQVDVIEREIENGVSTIPRLVEVREDLERVLLQSEAVRAQSIETILRQVYLTGRLLD